MWELVLHHVPDFVGAASSKIMVLAMRAVWPGNICFNR